MKFSCSNPIYSGLNKSTDGVGQDIIGSVLNKHIQRVTEKFLLLRLYD